MAHYKLSFGGAEVDHQGLESWPGTTVIHIYVPVTKQYNMVMAYGQ